MYLNKHTINSQEKLTETSILPNEEKLTEYRKIYNERLRLSKKLDAEECWYGIMNIYYSCFTLILGVLSLTNKGKFLSLPGVLFTIILTFLVIYSNSQRRHARAVDLRANCTDFEKLLYEADCTIYSYNTTQNNESDNLEELSGQTLAVTKNTNENIDKILKEIVNKCIDLKKDSESPINMWKDLGIVSRLWIILLLVTPIIYSIFCVYFNWDNLCLLFRNHM